MADWLEQLLGESPLGWREAWWTAVNGKLWSLSLAAKQGRLILSDQDKLQQLVEVLPRRLPALQYLLRQEGLGEEQAVVLLAKGSGTHSMGFRQR